MNQRMQYKELKAQTKAVLVLQRVVRGMLGRRTFSDTKLRRSIAAIVRWPALPATDWMCLAGRPSDSKGKFRQESSAANQTMSSSFG